MNTRNLGRIPYAAAISVLALLLSGTTALADTELGHTGKVGAHMLRDTLDTPGMECHYQARPEPQIGEDLVSFTVRAPKVFARNKTSGLDRGRVGWRFIIDQAPNNAGQPGAWTRFYKSRVWKANATDSQFASFSSKNASPTIGSADLFFRVRIKMFWYRGDGSTVGKAVHLVDYYRTNPAVVVGPAGYCHAHSH